MLLYHISNIERRASNEKASDEIIRNCTGLFSAMGWVWKPPVCIEIRQVQYISSFEDNKIKPSGECLFFLGVSLFLHQQTRKKSLVDIATRLGIGEGYSRISRLEAQLANAIKRRLNVCYGLFIPPFFVEYLSVFLQ